MGATYHARRTSLREAATSLLCSHGKVGPATALSTSCLYVSSYSDIELQTAKFDVEMSDGLPMTLGSFNVHGQLLLPPIRYEWLIGEPAMLDSLSDLLTSRTKIHIGHSQSWIKMFTSIAQLILSCITIYRSRGPQLEEYGYAAYGLSVFPYAMMSFVNLLYNGALGEYPCLYVLRTAILDEARRCGGTISGEIGVLEQESHDRTSGEKGSPPSSGNKQYVAVWLRTEETEQGKILTARVDGRSHTKTFKLVGNEERSDHVFYIDSITNQERETANSGWSNRKFGSVLVCMVISAIPAFVLPHVFIFLLTGYKKRDSTVADRAWMMAWLVASQELYTILFMFGVEFPHFSWSHLYISRQDGTRDLVVFAFIVLPFLMVLFVPAIGGFVAVGRMFLKSSSCPLSL